MYVCLLIFCVYYDVCSYHEHEETWDIRNIVDVYTSLVTVKYSFIQDKYLYFPYYMYRLKHCRECYMEIWNKKSGRETSIARGEAECYILSQDHSLSSIFSILARAKAVL